MSGSSVQVLKRGDGIRARTGDLLELHIKTASSVDDLSNDQLVLSSTYRDGHPVVVVLDEDFLQKEVYEALLGLPVGTTLVVALDLDTLGYETNAARHVLFVEIWILGFGDASSSPRVIVASAAAQTNGSVDERLATAMAEARRQRNARAVTVGGDVEERWLNDVAFARSANSALSAPTRLAPTNIDGPSTYLVSLELFNAVDIKIKCDLEE